jgi:tRNA A-37 threonylcarbamoyl transferase component Bud32
MTSESQLGDLLMRWEELRQQGKSVAAEDLCAGTPELRDELRRRIEALKALDQVLDITPQPRNSTLTCEQGAPPPRELPAIPGYEVLGELGHGGMGVVYKVRNVGIGRVEALKMMVSPKPHMIERFRQEIRAIAQFEHQRVVRIYAAGPADGQPYFTMEYIGRGSLSAHLGRFKAHPSAAVGLLAKVAQAVHFLHTMNIIHRDLKPGNILLGDQDEPLVSDFGLATFFEREMEKAAPEPSGADSQLTRTGAIVGTTSYMSPEQAGGRTRELTAATDVWALGVILYELVTGRRPFVANGEAAVRDAILHSEPVSPRALQPKIDKDLEAICLKCLQKEPLVRYPSAAALAGDLERWLRGEPILARRQPLARRLLHRCRRHPAATIVCVCLLLLAGAAVSARFYLDPDRPLRDLENQLANGNRVVLIDKQGQPVWKRWRLNNGANCSLNAEGFFTVHSDNLALLDLIRDPKNSSFRFQAQIRHERSDRLGEVGLFFLAAKSETTNGIVLSFFQLSFNDIFDSTQDLKFLPIKPNPMPKGNPVQFRPRLAGAIDSRLGGFSPRLLQPVEFKGGHWHTLWVEVVQSDIQGYWDGILVGTASLETISKGVADDLTRLRINFEPPDFRANSPMGILVGRGTASFKEVFLEPLPN